MTAASAASFDSGDALVAYLSQRDASPAICELRSTSPHVTRFDREMAKALIRGLDEGKVDLPLGRACIDAVIEQGPPEAAAQLIGAVARGYRWLAVNPALETSPALQARLATLQAIYFERPSGMDSDPKAMDPIVEDLRRRFFGGHSARCRAVFTAPTVVASDSAISSSEKSNTSFNTTAARSCGDRVTSNVPTASRGARGSATAAARSGRSVGTSRWRRVSSIHRFEAMRNNQARGFTSSCPFMRPSVTKARASASCARSSASHGLRVRYRQYR